MKRSNGTGNIVNLGKNRRKPWAVRISVWVPNEDGVEIRKRKILATFSTRKEAQKRLDEYLSAPDAFASPVASKRLTLRDCIEIALDRSEETLSAHSVVQYRTSAKHLDPIADLPVARLNGELLQDLFDRLCASGLSRSVITCILTVLRKAIKVAQRKNALLQDPIQGIEIGRRIRQKPKQRNPFTHAEIMRLIAMDDPVAQDLVLMIYTGMRLSEFCTCRKYENGFLYVEESKTSAGVRIIPVADWLKPLVEDRMSRGSLMDKPLHPRYFWKVFREFCAENNLDHIPHETRHTFATLLDEARLPDGHRVDIVVAKVLLGHRVSDLTKGTYTHENIERLVEAVNALQNAWATSG